MTLPSLLLKPRHTVAVFLLATSCLSGLRAQTVAPSDSDGIRPDHIWTGDYLKLVLGDTGAILTAPIRWNQDEWLEAGAAVGAVGVTSVFDARIRDQVQAHRTAGEDRFMQHWQNLGSDYSFVILGGFEAWGEIGGNVRAKNVAMDGVAATIIASGLITTSLKIVIGRERPGDATRVFQFKSFAKNNSFPSGHATQAFAIATVIAEHYPTWWVEGLAYGSAALVGYARVEQNAHYASDVVAGSLIGWSVARAIVHRNDGPPNPKKLSWSPYANGTGGGLVFFKSF